ncbi:methylmalonyl-CoA mutase [Georgenia yuyongxinii]|uniref:Methylmalonyl-CoA mutase n=3 Tax=Georgenia yuyongxinii TaxID=2589797 RepID=A0A5B8BYR5_9MICO|nr:fused isobutyryl-CoA mutase/GTPase IcmF [Georgenia yuyongxinii]QDC23403.1 methylmalonyl-CoA mutase [Georgenia yuyongxinii]
MSNDGQGTQGRLALAPGSPAEATADRQAELEDRQAEPRTERGPALHVPAHPVRVVTAASLFDGHDAAINIIRRILQAQGCEVIHLGHDRSVAEVVAAAVQEDAQAVAISSYQGGHVEYFTYLADQLRAHGCGHVRVFGGGGGVIVADEIAALADVGVRIFSPEDGQRLGLAAMVNEVVREADVDPVAAAGGPPADLAALGVGDVRALARTLTALELGRLPEHLLAELRRAAEASAAVVLGITGTGGSGKSSLTDELLLRARLDQGDGLRMAVLAVDPTRRRGGGALLGDRIRMNALTEGTFFRSVATRGAGGDLPAALDEMVAAAKVWGADLVIVETPGIGQGDAGIVDHVDVPVYVMTPEFGAATQLEKIDMLDLAEVVVINKFDRRGAEDALRDVRRQVARNRLAFAAAPEALPVFGTVASRVHDDGVTALYLHLRHLLAGHGLPVGNGALAPVDHMVSTRVAPLVPVARVGYLAEAAEAVRAYHRRTAEQAAAARELQHLTGAREILAGRLTGAPAGLDDAVAEAEAHLTEETRVLLAEWPTLATAAGAVAPAVSLSGTPVPRLALPRLHDDGDLLTWLRGEHLPGHFPYTAGVFTRRRTDEHPARMFAGEGDPARTNRRFHLLASGQPAVRLSTAFDSVTLYGSDPDTRPDIYGKVGNSGVSIATLADMKALYAGFDLCAPSTSVSMTINGPAPTILAMFLNTAIDQRLDAFAAAHGRPPSVTEAADLRAEALRTVRGTVQADILKEDQGQNTCIFSTDFSLKVMADIQEWFVAHEVKRFYSVSISGYHIAEAGANPISQLAFTLANGLTYVEAYLARGMAVDDFAPSLSFFFSNGMDPEYSVLGRVARRVWAIVLRDRYGATARSQRLKYHIQTSGRSLHAQEMAFNDIRTTLQALIALYDTANSLHTNAYDEAVTTPTEESVRRALAIQLIINSEWGPMSNENPNQGSFLIAELTDLVERAVLDELDRLSARGGVLGAMETGYQRGRIQDESMLYEQRKHDGSLPIVGVNTFRAPDGDDGDDGGGAAKGPLRLARSTEAEKRGQVERLRAFQAAHAEERPAALARLQSAALAEENVFDVLMDVVRVASLGEITQALFEVGGKYRRNV